MTRAVLYFVYLPLAAAWLTAIALFFMGPSWRAELLAALSEEQQPGDW